ncbi:capsule assembly Wzi family protein [Celerinatantimonas yamalensis]|uniref:Capsule assembly Wzi family protein n=1 Tax=Celerinatantimonas yamalensis TaxID=559956 RepID=A0ABW9G4D5_9GAMM
MNNIHFKRLNKNRLAPAGLALSACLSVFVSFLATASPWLEPDNAYLRSDLQALADAGLIHTPINTYPLRWSGIDSDLQDIDTRQLSPALRQSYAHITYAIQGALIDRGNRQFKASYAKTPRDDSSFAAPLTQKWQALSSYELTSHHYAFRLAANYHRGPNKFGHEKNEFSLDNSYIAFNAGNASISLGSVQRWWGPTWIYNLAWGHTRGTIPGVDLAYDAYNWPVIGSWHVETFIGSQRTPNNNQKQWSSRLEFAPVSWLNLGMSYQKWFSKSGLTGYVTGPIQSDANQQDQYSGDIRLSLPSINVGQTTVTQSVYAQGATLINDQSLGSTVLGWQSQFNIGEQYLRWIVEVKNLTADAKQQWQQGLANRSEEAGLHNQLAVNNGDVGESKTIKLLWVSPTDWEWTLQGQRYQTVNEQNKNRMSASVELPLANSRLTIGSDYNASASAGVDQWNYWGSWDFRF